ncbi:hypothetical protein AOQ84DRAFT_183457 [Glonium stellatum]|uniref:Uncharacterized protein n=1 Tax=Glonium stellatum TaxID=574774 RepID=A0A8E2JW27_9PEZI|nr:hypothetical protein AOQ84DRAFT_183457 [Glonium stellatum]
MNYPVHYGIPPLFNQAVFSTRNKRSHVAVDIDSPRLKGRPECLFHDPCRRIKHALCNVTIVGLLISLSLKIGLLG